MPEAAKAKKGTRHGSNRKSTGSSRSPARMATEDRQDLEAMRWVLDHTCTLKVSVTQKYGPTLTVESRGQKVKRGDLHEAVTALQAEIVAAEASIKQGHDAGDMFAGEEG